jgi:hypothetical protein
MKEADGMSRLRLPLAICLALTLVFSLGAPSVGWADGPGKYSTNSGPTDGGDGHPWDDGTGEQSSPGEDDEDPQQEVESGIPDPEPVFAVQKGLLSWTQRTLVSLWHKVRNVARSQTTAVKTKLELKPKKSRPVR